MSPIDLLVETNFHRAAPGGMGGTKCAGNYSPVLVTQLQAKDSGYADVVYLDAKTNTFLEEVSSCNIFVVTGKTVATPPLSGTILPGVTRRSVIKLLQDRGYEVKEEEVAVKDACEADEVFTTGTAVVVASVGSLTFDGALQCCAFGVACKQERGCTSPTGCRQCCQWLHHVTDAHALDLLGGSSLFWLCCRCTRQGYSQVCAPFCDRVPSMTAQGANRGFMVRDQFGERCSCCSVECQRWSKLMSGSADMECCHVCRCAASVWRGRGGGPCDNRGVSATDRHPAGED